MIDVRVFVYFCNKNAIEYTKETNNRDRSFLKNTTELELRMFNTLPCILVYYTTQKSKMHSYMCRALSCVRSARDLSRQSTLHTSAIESDAPAIKHGSKSRDCDDGAITSLLSSIEGSDHSEHSDDDVHTAQDTAATKYNVHAGLLMYIAAARAKAIGLGAQIWLVPLCFLRII